MGVILYYYDVSIYVWCNKNKIAVDRLSFTLTSGVSGLLGANGAGKTTLMRMICGILKPTSGEVKFDGVDVSMVQSNPH